jgi:hypothetical protein
VDAEVEDASRVGEALLDRLARRVPVRPMEALEDLGALGARQPAGDGRKDAWIVRRAVQVD